jgi:Peptidase inhibitor family I36
MRLPRRPSLIATASLMSIGLLASVPASAQTARAGAAARPDSLSSCGAHTLCLWENSGYSGTQWSYAYADYAHDSWIYVGAAANDQASSLYNNRGDYSDISKNSPPSSNGQTQACVQPGDSVSDLANYEWTNGTAMNDSISAFDLTTNPGPVVCIQTF